MRHAARGHAWSWSIVLFGLAGSACSRGPVPCLAPRDCSSGFECLAHTCRRLGSDPVAPGAQRTVLFPTQRGVAPDGTPYFVDFELTSDERAPSRAAPEEPQPPAARRLERAYLLFDPQERGPLGSAELALEVALLLDPWEPGATEQGPLPRTSIAQAYGRLQAGRRGSVDVTELVVAWLAHPERYHGLSIGLAADPTGLPATIRASKLDLYWSALPRRASARPRGDQ